ncbi:PHP domain-containing protein [Clostridium sp. P21]|uniref:PHP domain-containing protein n=1 Tax=Clostridium muellerianum TaxID=2716538 RepID=A0A7Y0EFQ6_9CLOT|nr:PHP domain-containing protein [Clostridium muellerianum]NMM62659.1 PHP domain-containing protein [Clostridium muellerianum]
MYTKGDFHLHTTASDGKFSPKELVAMAKKENIDIMSITDHDTIHGIDEAVQEGKRLGIKVVPGIELSTLYREENVHILGYFNDTSKIGCELKNYLKGMHEYRTYRGKKIVENLDRIFNIKLNYEKILNDAEGIIARPHIAKAIISAGYKYPWDYIFTNFIGENSPAYVPNRKLDTKDGIKLLKKNNALVVLAHPVLIKNIDITEILNMPFDGIEAIYSMNSANDTKIFKTLSEKHNKIITAGSDFHGITKEDSKHPLKIGQVSLDEKNIKIFLEKLKEV